MKHLKGPIIEQKTTPGTFLAVFLSGGLVRSNFDISGHQAIMFIC